MFDFPEFKFLIYQFGIALLGGCLISFGGSILVAFFFASSGWGSVIIGLLSFFILFTLSSYLLVIQSAKWFKLSGSRRYSLLASVLFTPTAFLGLDWWFVLGLPVVELLGFYYKRKK